MKPRTLERIQEIERLISDAHLIVGRIDEYVEDRKVHSQVVKALGSLQAAMGELVTLRTDLKPRPGAKAKTFRGEEILMLNADYMFTDARHREVHAYFKSDTGQWLYDSKYADLKDAKKGVELAKAKHDERESWGRA